MKLYGTETHDPTNPYNPSRVPVVGSVERSSNGNVILRIGRKAPAFENRWEQTEHVILSPEEAREFVQEILALLDEG